MLQANGDVEKKAGLLRSRLADPPNVQHLSWELFEREPADKESLHSTIWMLCERGSQHLLKLATNWPRRSRKGTVRKIATFRPVASFDRMLQSSGPGDWREPNNHPISNRPKPEPVSAPSAPNPVPNPALMVIFDTMPTRIGPRSRRSLKYESANGGAAEQNGNDPCQVFTVHFVPLLVPFHQAQGDIRSSNRERYSAPP
jgi:hypothetical protein